MTRVMPITPALWARRQLLKLAISGIPGVVAITTDNQIVRGAFYVRVLLTEQPHGNTFSLVIDGGAS